MRRTRHREVRLSLHLLINSRLHSMSPVPRPVASPANRIFPTALRRQAWAALIAGLVTFSPAPTHGNALLFDFGADGTQTVGGSSGEVLHWNNVPAGTGADDFGLVPNLLLTDGNPTDISLEMVSRFNGANENGTTASGLYPASATRDSLYGNTELFGGLENVTPIFKLTGLPAGATYTLTFYASRTGVGDNRE
ncbi:MAG TPA: hypothetical protein PKE47_13930, partial [Verrucomicrobiota bacterium]|nr:hypothetical protein [Verrucomicrobiota bacterium]